MMEVAIAMTHNGVIMAALFYGRSRIFPNR
jgi:hypothetical protein